MIERTLFGEEHAIFRDAARRFMEQEVFPHRARWEEQSRVGATGPGFGLHSEIVAPYLLDYGREELKRRYLPMMARGEMIGRSL